MNQYFLTPSWRRTGLAYFVVPIVILCQVRFGWGDRHVEANRVAEFTFRSDTRSYDDPFNDVQLDAVFRTPNGRTLTASRLSGMLAVDRKELDTRAASRSMFTMNHPTMNYLR